MLMRAVASVMTDPSVLSIKCLCSHMYACRYTKAYNRVTGWWMLRYRPGSDDCVFLGIDNACTIHEVRPVQCSTYPWWPDLMQDEAAWQWEKGKFGT